MIKNEKQYQITKKRRKEFSESLRDLELNYSDGDLLKQIQIDAIKSQVEDFDKEVKEYEILKKGLVSELQIDSILKFPELLIKSRIAKGWSHSELAGKLGLDEQQIQRYEATDYSTASFARIVEIFIALEIQLTHLKVKVGEVKFKWSIEINETLIQKAQDKLSKKGTLLELCN